MNSKDIIRIKAEPACTMAALIHLSSIGFTGKDAGFLNELFGLFEQKGKLPNSMIKAAGRLLIKHGDELDGLELPQADAKPKKKSVRPLSFTLNKNCVLRNASPKIIKQLKKALTFKNPAYDEALKFGRYIGKELKPKLYFFRVVGPSFIFPRGFLDEALEIINPAQIRDKRQTLPAIKFSFSGEDRPYQEEAIDGALSHDFGVIESGTGSGKTVMALSIIARRKQPTLILVHSKELLYQWAERIDQFLGIKAGLIGDGNFDIRPVTVAIINSAKNNIEKLPQHFGHLVVDECHRVPSTMFTQVATAFNCRYMLGLTATAFRRDGLSQLIPLYLGSIRAKIKIEDLHAVGAVLKPRYYQHYTEFDFEYEENYSTMISALTKDSERNSQILQDIKIEIISQSGIILVVSDRVPHCKIFAEALAADGVAVALLTGGTGTAERQKIVEDVGAGLVEILVSTVQLIGEGFDCPGLCVLFLTTPIKFVGRLQQIIGRILRPGKDKTAIVHDYCDPIGVLERSAATRLKLYK